MARSWSTELECVGMQFRWTKDGRETLARSVPFPVDLEREPENRSDENAIKVNIAADFKLKKLRGVQLGYIRRNPAALLAPRLDAGTLAVKKIWVNEVDVESGTAMMDCRFTDLEKPRRRRRRNVS